MPAQALSTKTDQVVEQLREGMLEARWREFLPGRDRLAKELGCSHGTVEAALRQLLREGTLVSEGAGKRRRIVLPRGKARKRAVRVRILLYEQADRSMPDLAELLTRLQFPISTEIANLWSSGWLSGWITWPRGRTTDGKCFSMENSLRVARSGRRGRRRLIR